MNQAHGCEPGSFPVQVIEYLVNYRLLFNTGQYHDPTNTVGADFNITIENSFKPPGLYALRVQLIARRLCAGVFSDGFARLPLLAGVTSERKWLLAESVDADIIDLIPEEVPLSADTADSVPATYLCPDCGSLMVIIECFEHGHLPRAPPLRISA